MNVQASADEVAANLHGGRWTRASAELAEKLVGIKRSSCEECSKTGCRGNTCPNPLHATFGDRGLHQVNSRNVPGHAGQIWMCVWGVWSPARSLERGSFDTLAGKGPSALGIARKAVPPARGIAMRPACKVPSRSGQTLRASETGLLTNANEPEAPMLVQIRALRTRFRPKCRRTRPRAGRARVLNRPPPQDARSRPSAAPQIQVTVLVIGRVAAEGLPPARPQRLHPQPGAARVVAVPPRGRRRGAGGRRGGRLGRRGALRGPAIHAAVPVCAPGKGTVQRLLLLFRRRQAGPTESTNIGKAAQRLHRHCF